MSLILEKSVILISKYKECLFLAIEALSNLTYPLELPHIIVSTLPQNLLHLKQAPVPILMGIESDFVRFQDLEGDADAAVYNLDTGIGSFAEIPYMCNKVSTKLRLDLV